MGGLLFVSQTMLDSWADQGRIDLVRNVMTVLAGGSQGRSYALEPAVRFMKILGADSDPNGLLHKVKTHAQLNELGAEPVDDSCILGDVAYEVQPGFLAETAALQAAAAATAPTTAEAAAARPAAAAAPSPASSTGERPSSSFGSAPLPRDLEERRKEAEALARFLLENLS